jgi:hypothetical protein
MSQIKLPEASRFLPELDKNMIWPSCQIRPWLSSSRSCRGAIDQIGQSGCRTRPPTKKK